MTGRSVTRRRAERGVGRDARKIDVLWAEDLHRPQGTEAGGDGVASIEDWWRWGRVELPVQDPSPETTTSVSDGLSSTARTGIGTLPDGPVTCP